LKRAYDSNKGPKRHQTCLAFQVRNQVCD